MLTRLCCVAQFQYLADKYAPAAPEIAETLSKLHLPPHASSGPSSSVPLPNRGIHPPQHQVAVFIRDGRRAASQLASLGEASKTTGSTRGTLSQTSREETSMSTALEHDFTVEGKRGDLRCPFSKAAMKDELPDVDEQDRNAQSGHDSQSPSSDPICAAMDELSVSQPAAANGSTGGSKCPIRYMDKHSPEEIAHYVETHKHELPRSHEVCVRRYQRSEEQIRKLDSKYGNLVSMIEGLSQLHQPMLPESGENGVNGAEPEENQVPSNGGGHSNERVENWAQDVSATPDLENHQGASQDDDRESRFDRPLKEIRVGESPSRPWGISVPLYDAHGNHDDRPLSPPPAPVHMPQDGHGSRPPGKGPSKCPIDHTKFAALGGMPGLSSGEALRPHAATQAQPAKSPLQSPFTSAQQPPAPPAFVNPDMTKATGGAPQMVFTGPVFIGYPMEQAIQFLNQYRESQ